MTRLPSPCRVMDFFLARQKERHSGINLFYLCFAWNHWIENKPNQFYEMIERGWVVVGLLSSSCYQFLIKAYCCEYTNLTGEFFRISSCFCVKRHNELITLKAVTKNRWQLQKHPICLNLKRRRIFAKEAFLAPNIFRKSNLKYFYGN